MQLLGIFVTIVKAKAKECTQECCDRDDLCKYWVDQDECKRSDDWMIKNCAESCHLCSNVVNNVEDTGFLLLASIFFKSFHIRFLDICSSRKKKKTLSLHQVQCCQEHSLTAKKLTFRQQRAEIQGRCTTTARENLI